MGAERAGERRRGAHADGAEAEPDGLICFLPLGSFEQHGVWPWDVDTRIATAFARELAELTGGAVLPPLPFSCSWEWRSSVSLRVETLSAVLRDVNDSCKRMGKVLVVVNAHGGNSGLLEALARQYGFLVVDVWRSCGIKVGHCDEVERSVAQALGIELPPQPYKKGWPEKAIRGRRLDDGCYGFEGDAGEVVRRCVEEVAEEIMASLKPQGTRSV